MSDHELALKLLDHAEWMVTSGQFRGTVSRYLDLMMYPSDAVKALVIAEYERRATS